MDDPSSARPLRRLQIDLIELEVAFDNSSPDMSYYLDLETGSVVLVTSEAIHALQDEDEEDVESGKASDWFQNAIDDARRVAADDVRYVVIPSPNAAEEYDSMRDFIATVANESLRERLWGAIQGGAFRRFRDVLLDYPDERQRWFEFEQECDMQHILDWLADEGIEPVLRDDVDETDDADEVEDVDVTVPAADHDFGSGC